MKIIIDTNIWYDLYDDKSLLKDINPLLITPNFLNYFEIIKNKNIVSNQIKSSWILKKMDDFQILFEPPFVHIAKLYKFYHYNVLLELKDYISFLIYYKSGAYISPYKSDDFFKYIGSINKDFQDFSDLYNKEAKFIKNKISNNKKHLKIKVEHLIQKHVSVMVEAATGKNVTRMDFSKIELLIKTLHQYYKKLEIGEIQSETNDIVDFFMLSYVQPGDLYITRDKKWKKLIADAGCSNYLRHI